MSVRELLFYLVILVTNIIQGITGFAGTILAMPPSLYLVGYEVAKPILNLLGLLAGLYVFAGGYRRVNKKEVKKIIVAMLPGIVVGILLKDLLICHEKVMMQILGIFVLALAVQGFVKQSGKRSGEEKRDAIKGKNVIDLLLLVSAGVIHGIFVSGGPLLVTYVSRKIKEKEVFRVTVSTIWILLNGIILIDDIRSGYWDGALVQKQMIALPFFFAGMLIGGKLCKRMSRGTFLMLTYVLLFFSGISLLAKG